jgi:hypothetical protein
MVVDEVEAVLEPGIRAFIVVVVVLLLLGEGAVGHAMLGIPLGEDPQLLLLAPLPLLGVWRCRR